MLVNNATTAHVLNPPWSGERIKVSILYGSVALIGMVAYAFFLHLSNKNLKWAKGFRYLINQLAVADLGMLSLNLFVYVPMTLTGREFLGRTLTVILTSLETFFWHSLKFTTFLISLSRFGALVWPWLGSFFFEKYLYASMSLAWLSGVWYTVTHTVVGCWKVYFTDTYGFGFECGRNETILFEDQIWHSIFLGQNMLDDWLITTSTVIVYIILFVWLQIQKKNSIAAQSDAQAKERQARELRMLAQGFIIGVTVWLVLLAFWGVFRQPVEFFEQFPGIFVFLTLITMINSLINPFVYFAFNRKLRNALFKMFGVKVADSETAATAGTAMQQN